MTVPMKAGRPNGTFTGRHMTIIMVAFFGVVIAVNFYMASLASSSFTGIVVENSYVASQHFNRWLDEARTEDKLGWKAAARRDASGHVALTLTGVPVDARVTGTAWHPLGRSADRILHFGPGLTSQETIPAGRWRIRIEVTAGGRRWRAEDMVS